MDKLRLAKEKLRKASKEKLKAQPKDIQAEQKIQKSLFKFIKASEKETILLAYLATSVEFNTLSLLEHLAANKEDLSIYAPRVISSKKNGAKMDFYKLDFDEKGLNTSNLEKSNYGILEPKIDKSRQFNLDRYLKNSEDINLYVLMPGLLFDKNGNRLGHGAGYYDRYLARLDRKYLSLVPLLPSNIYTDELPSGPNDIKMDIYFSKDKVKLLNKAKLNLLNHKQRAIVN